MWLIKYFLVLLCSVLLLSELYWDLSYYTSSSTYSSITYSQEVSLHVNYVEDVTFNNNNIELRESSEMFDCGQFRSYIVRPTLKEMGLWSKEAEDLLVGTAAVESKLGTYLKQINGPALGVYQMEPATHKDIYQNYLRYKWDISEDMATDLGEDSEGLVYDLQYATKMTRYHYRRVPEPLPNEKTFDSKASYTIALGSYWKEHYNTFKGKGSVEKFTKAYYDCGCAV